MESSKANVIEDARNKIFDLQSEVASFHTVACNYLGRRSKRVERWCFSVIFLEFYEQLQIPGLATRSKKINKEICKDP